MGNRHKVSTAKVINPDELSKAHKNEEAKEAAIKKAVAKSINNSKKTGS